jgi:hypothetical protein
MSVKALFTVRGLNPVSTAILENLRDKQQRDPKKYPVEILICDTEAEAYGAAQLDMVGLFDTDWYSAGRYSPAVASKVFKKPEWLGLAYWAILVNPVPFTPKAVASNASPDEKDRATKIQERCKNRIDNCADQIRAMFVVAFDAKRAVGLAPWEAPQKDQKADQPPEVPQQAQAADAGIVGFKSMRCYA